MSGALRPDSGTIRFDGAAIERQRTHLIARLVIARTFQLVRSLPGMTGAENVAAGLAFRRGSLWGAAARRQADALLDRVGLGGRQERPAGQLTYIAQKRLERARALALEPRLLLLDEWLAGLN